jgi:hypothetical protein
MKPNNLLINGYKNKIKSSKIEIISYLIFLGMGLFGIYIQFKEFNMFLFIGSIGLIYVSLASISLTLRSV